MILRSLLISLLAFAGACAQASVGLTQVTPVEGEQAVTVFYPTQAAEQPVQRGPFTVSVAMNATPAEGNHRLVVISHGSGGNAWVYADLARALVNAGFVVAMPLHKGDNAADPSHPGPTSWKMRPVEVSHAIDAVAHDARFAPLLAFDKVGMYGMSAGGHTALTLAGGRWSAAALRDHCEANIADDFQGCVGLATHLSGNAVLDAVKKSVALMLIRSRFDDATWQSYTDPRIQAVVAGVPYAADFDASSLAQPKVALGLITARKDIWLVPKFHGDRIVAACTSCEVLADIRDGGHGALLSPQLPPQVMGDLLRTLVSDPPGFDRSQMAEVDRKIASFFQRHLQ